MSAEDEEAAAVAHAMAAKAVDAVLEALVPAGSERDSRPVLRQEAARTQELHVVLEVGGHAADGKGGVGERLGRGMTIGHVAKAVASIYACG